MKITAKSHPFLFEAFQIIDHDSGRLGRLNGKITEYDVPERCEAMVAPSERLLAVMTRGERETVAIGEREEAKAIFELIYSADVDILKELLSEHFCDYCAGNNPAGA